jgi:hypothetical protein
MPAPRAALVLPAQAGRAAVAQVPVQVAAQQAAAQEPDASYLL